MGPSIVGGHDSHVRTDGSVIEVEYGNGRGFTQEGEKGEESGGTA